MAYGGLVAADLRFRSSDGSYAGRWESHLTVHDRWGSHLTSHERWRSHLANAGEVIFIFLGHWGSREYELELDTCDEHLMMKFDIYLSRLGAV